MIDMDSRLDGRLRSFYDLIEEEIPPATVTGFQPERSRRPARGLNVVLISAALAAVAVAVVGFAIELRAHLNSPGPAGPPIHTTPTPSPAPARTSGPLPVVQGNLVANAGFVSPQVGVITSVTALKAWTVVGNVELVPAGTIGEPFFGNQYLVLEPGPVQGAVSQRVKTVPGTNYEVVFTTGDAPACQGSGMLDLYWNGRYVSGTEMTSSTQSSSSDLGWSTDAFVSALATATNTTVSFVGTGQCGASLNQVIVQPYPLPTG